ncbi:hypothetical protein ACFVWF_32815 [Rhodococcus qingshengii]|uniref:hypothetical protein n=1 Tax=Rhodococcus qingshengii TaxID=334542 RepID=UPI0036D8B358
MPVLRAILHDRYTWEVHAAAVALALLVLLFALIPGVTAIMVLPAALALAAVVSLGFWLSPVTYRNRGVADADRPDRVEPDRVGVVQVLDPRLEIATTASELFEHRIARATARRNGMGIPVCSPAVEAPFDNGGVIGERAVIVNNTGRPIHIFSRSQRTAMRKVLAPSKDDPFFHRGTPHYNEATRVLGKLAGDVLTGSVRQINGRWLKVGIIQKDSAGMWLWDRATGATITKTLRVRIPRDSWLCKDFKHAKV